MTETKQVAKYEAKSPVRSQATLKAILERATESIAEIAANNLSAERLCKLVLVAASRQPALLECTSESILKSVMTSAELGLDCSGTLGQAYLVPFYNAKIKAKEALLIPGYRGLMELAFRSGNVRSIEAEIVRENDRFIRRLGDDPAIEHSILHETIEDRGDVRGCYAIATLSNGSKVREYMTAEEIEKVRQLSKAKDFGPWKDFTDEMIKKTVVRRLAKWLPMSVDSPLAKGFEADNATFDESAFASVQDVARENAGKGRMAMPRLAPTPEPEPSGEEYDPTSDPESGYVGDDETLLDEATNYPKD